MAESAGFVYLTPEGREKMLEELKRLKAVDRRQIVAEISRARDHGDLSENAEYHAAKEKQVFIERKISELEEKARRIKVIDASEVETDRAYLLCMVRVQDCKSGEEILYQLVSPEEADFDLDRISIESPVGRGLLGKARGETVKIQIPAGVLKYKILSIDRPS